jgi:flagella basal body P-ring formation protein FlgA
MVERGQQVVMIAQQDGIEARTMGEAMKKGRKGEMIKVKNTSSERVVTAIVDGMGVVRMVYAPGK